VTTVPYRSVRSIRTLLVTIAMLIASTLFAAGTASADVLNPRVDTGGSGGGGGSAPLVTAEQARTTPHGTLTPA
jgi:hypothetical protein